MTRLLFFFILFLPLFFPTSAMAAKYTLTAPTGTLTRGQNVDFIVNIDTQGETVTSGSTEVSYKTQYLQYVSTTKGNFFSTVTPTDTGSSIKLTGSTTPGKTGTGTFATLTFKLIADAPGETELCTIVSPTPTPSPTGKVVMTSTPTPKPTSTPIPTNTPKPTVVELPRSGTFETTIFLSALGISLSSLGIFLRKIK